MLRLRFLVRLGIFFACFLSLSQAALSSAVETKRPTKKSKSLKKWKPVTGVDYRDAGPRLGFETPGWLGPMIIFQNVIKGTIGQDPCVLVKNIDPDCKDICSLEVQYVCSDHPGSKVFAQKAKSLATILFPRFYKGYLMILNVTDRNGKTIKPGVVPIEPEDQRQLYEEALQDNGLFKGFVERRNPYYDWYLELELGAILAYADDLSEGHGNMGLTTAQGMDLALRFDVLNQFVLQGNLVGYSMYDGSKFTPKAPKLRHVRETIGGYVEPETFHETAKDALRAWQMQQQTQASVEKRARAVKAELDAFLARPGASAPPVTVGEPGEAWVEM